VRSWADNSPLPQPARPRMGWGEPQAGLATGWGARGGGGRGGRSRLRRWSTMRLTTRGSVMKLTTRISAPQRRHTRGSTSYTRLRTLAGSGSPSDVSAPPAPGVSGRAPVRTLSSRGPRAAPRPFGAAPVPGSSRRRSSAYVSRYIGAIRQRVQLWRVELRISCQRRSLRGICST
jgi:hypothetical protein